jgi:NTP pyrophosphatase (non-canonical NTP hydrolase)
MNRREYLITCLVEECSEVQKAATKILRFGMDDQYKEKASNIEELSNEIYDVMAIIQLLRDEKILPSIPIEELTRIFGAKQEKVEYYMGYSRKKGCLLSADEDNS